MRPSLTRVGELPGRQGRLQRRAVARRQAGAGHEQEGPQRQRGGRASLKEIARIPTSKTVVHGIAFSPDSRVAYISCESVGSDPGAVDMIDLAARKVVASISVPGQPTGIAIGSPRPAHSTH